MGRNVSEDSFHLEIVMIKTALFFAISREAETARKICRDLLVLLRLSEKQVNACSDCLLKIVSETLTRSQRQENIQRTATENEISFLDAMPAIAVMEFFLDRLDEEDYKSASVDVMAEDFCECCKNCEGLDNVDPEEDIESFKRTFTFLRECKQC